MVSKGVKTQWWKIVSCPSIIHPHGALMAVGSLWPDAVTLREC